MSWENIVGKGEIACNERFLLFNHSVYFLYGECPAIFTKLEILVCKLFLFENI